MADVTVLTDESEEFVIIEVENVEEDKRPSAFAKRTYATISGHSNSELVARKIIDGNEREIFAVGPRP